MRSSRPAASRSSSSRPTSRPPSKYKDKIASGALVLVVADTLAMQIEQLKLGLASGNVGQRPFDMGYKAMYFLQANEGRQAGPEGPDLHRPRRLHAEERRHLHRQVTVRA